MTEVYISFDVEANGPIPGFKEYSMASLGACVVGETEKSFYAVLKPISENFISEAMAVHGISMEEQKKGLDPAEGMKKFSEWVESVGKNKRIVFVSFGEFDYLFLKWYLVNYGFPKLGGPNWLDMKSYYMGMAKTDFGSTTKKKIPSFLKGSRKHTHNALDDAVEQAELFELMLKNNKN